ncbi:MAG: hypothetical protein ABI706_21255 [Ilumatobacteraceae bacterium]
MAWVMYDEVSYLWMAKAISVRLDDDAERALRMLEASGLTLSEEDRAEMVSVASLMESMRAAR